MKKFLILLLAIFGLWWGYNKLANNFKKIGEKVHNPYIEDEVAPVQMNPETKPEPLPVVVPNPSNSAPDNQPSHNENQHPSRAYEPTAEDLNPPSNEILPDSQPNNPLAFVPGNTLVSCQTKVQFCEPQNGNYSPDEANNSTFCITFAGNCDDTSTIQRTWTEEEVFNNRPVEQPEVPHYDQPIYPNNDYRDENQIPGEPPPPAYNPQDIDPNNPPMEY